MISIEDILILHERSITNYGGMKGIRDPGMLESAIARPFQTFSGDELYPEAHQKAAALAESLIINHPFVDGNKRIGALTMIAFLKHEGYKLVAPSDNLYQMIISISTGELKFEEIVNWLKENTQEI